MNESNLRPISLSHEEAVKNGRKGGVASGVARRKKRRWCDLLNEALQTTQKTDSGQEKTLEEIAALELVKKFAEGDLKAIRLVLEITGELHAYLEEEICDDE